MPRGVRHEGSGVRACGLRGGEWISVAEVGAGRGVPMVQKRKEHETEVTMKSDVLCTSYIDI